MILAGVDVGGTFTDLALYDSNTGKINVVKVPTTSYPEDGVIITLQSLDEKIDQTSLLYHATTIATNALLTRKGLGHTALITNHGFRDILEIGRQRRPELYNLKTQRPVPLVPRRDRYTVRGRILADGSEYEPLNIEDLRKIAKRIIENHHDSVAISFLNSYTNPEHEVRTRELLVKTGFKGHIDISSEVNTEYREYERTSTTVVNSVLKDVVSKYLSRLEKKLRKNGLNCPLYVMKSDGTASTIQQAITRPTSIIESGPAAGVLASKTLAKILDVPNVISFDMGGTTAKASAITNGKMELSYEFEAAGKIYHGRSLKGSGYPVRQSFIDLAEVSSGGGTIAWLDETGTLKLGPQSSGADPGPAAYGRGGVEPTVTDANIVTGRINPNQILGGRLKLEYDLAEKSLKRISGQIKTGIRQTAQNILRLANNNMTQALSLVSRERGRDPRDYTMIAFGGAGPLHACDIAEELEIKRIIVPLHPGMFSALGLLTSKLSRTFSKPIMKPVTRSLGRFFKQLRLSTGSSLYEEGFTVYDGIESVDLRYQGQAYEINVPYNKDTNLEQLFGREHRKLYGYSSNDPVEAVNARIQAVIPTPKIRRAEKKLHSSMPPTPASSRTVSLYGGQKKVRVYNRDNLRSGMHGKGPCIIEEYDSTTLIQEDWLWKIDKYENLDLTYAD